MLFGGNENKFFSCDSFTSILENSLSKVITITYGEERCHAFDGIQDKFDSISQPMLLMI
jgi:hypothetical protein